MLHNCHTAIRPVADLHIAFCHSCRCSVLQFINSDVFLYLNGCSLPFTLITVTVITVIKL